MDKDRRQYEFMRPITDGWKRMLGECYKSKKQFDTVARMCESFFTADLGFMWKPEFTSQFMGGDIAPKFKITVAKGFELVAIFGPSLYWRYATRVCQSYDPIELYPELFGDPNDQVAQAMYQQSVDFYERDSKIKKTRNSIMEKYLNYSQREQPGGGLARHSESAITEALIKGRGCLWPEVYSHPGSGRKLTGCFYDSVDNLFIDPDSTDPMLADARFIMRRHCDPWWEVERRFKLKKNSLKERANSESAESMALQQTESDKMYRKAGKVNDLVTWYEIFSRGGAGNRMKGVVTGLSDPLDDVVGDFAYICIATNVDYPLNAPPEFLMKASDDEVKEAFRWPVPFWKDTRFPVALLDFYRQPKSPWPLAPMAMGLGELMFLNVMISLLCNRVYTNTRSIIAYLKSAASNVEEQLKSGRYECFVELNDAAHKSINEIIQFLNQPDISFDMFRVIDMISEMFDKRVGLTELLYGLNPGGKVSRSAADINAKTEMTSVRPEYMANKVEDFQTEAANLEKFAAGWNVSGEDISPLVGPVGAMLWDDHIANEDPEVFVYEMKAMVEAGSARRPNKLKDAENLNTLAGYVLPELGKQADATGDTGPLNAFFESIGKAYNQDTSGWYMEERKPQISEEEQQMQQMQFEFETNKQQLELQTKQLELQGKQVELQGKQMEIQGKQVEIEGKVIEGEQKKAELLGESNQGMTPDQMRLLVEAERQDQQLRHEEEKHRQQLLFDAQEHEQEMEQARQEADLKVITAASLADAQMQKAQQAAELAEEKAKQAKKKQAAKE